MSGDKTIIHQKSSEEIAFELYKDMCDLTTRNNNGDEIQYMDHIGISRRIPIKQKIFEAALKLVRGEENIDLSNLIS